MKLGEKLYFFLDALIPIIAAAVVLGCLIYTFPIIRGALFTLSEVWKTDLTPLGDVILIASVVVFASFLVVRCMGVYYRYWRRTTLIEATEIGAKQLTELREMLERALRLSGSPFIKKPREKTKTSES